MHAIRLGNTVFEGENNAYLLGTEPGETTTLIDTGVSLPAVKSNLAAGLASYGLEYADVEAIVLTHFHYDHAGLAGEIQAESGAPVYVHRADAPLVAGEPAALANQDRRRRAALDRWGVPDGPRDELLAFAERHESLRGLPADVTPFDDGERFDVGSTSLIAYHLPGHTAGLAGFALGDDGAELVAGDALLPKYTPNVGGADVRVDDPLGTYIDSLQRIVDGGFDRVWPGHRDPIDDPVARAVEIVDHHRTRTDRVVDVLRDRGAADAWTVSADLFGSLERIHILHGPGEAFAHLDHLEHQGVVEREGTEYRLTVDEVDGEDVVPPLST